MTHTQLRSLIKVIKVIRIKVYFAYHCFNYFCKNFIPIEKLLFYLPGMSYSYSENHYNESKDQEEETVLEEIMRKAAIGRYVVY